MYALNKYILLSKGMGHTLSKVDSFTSKSHELFEPLMWTVFHEHIMSCLR